MLLRRKGICLATYIDNWFLAGQLEQEALEYTSMLTQHQSALGFLYKHVQKCSDSHSGDFIYCIGLSLNSLLFKESESVECTDVFWLCLDCFQ